MKFSERFLFYEINKLSDSHPGKVISDFDRYFLVIAKINQEIR